MAKRTRLSGPNKPRVVPLRGLDRGEKMDSEVGGGCTTSSTSSDSRACWSSTPADPRFTTRTLILCRLRDILWNVVRLRVDELNSCLRTGPLPVRWVSSSSIPNESWKPSDASLGNSYVKGRVPSSSLKIPSIEVDVNGGNGSIFLFQLVLRESVWLEVTGPITDPVELADEVESLGFLDGEYAMHSGILS